MESEQRPLSSQTEASSRADSYNGSGRTTSSGDDDDYDDLNIIGWNGKDGPEQPFNWPSWQIVLNCIMINLASSIAPLGCSKRVVTKTRRDRDNPGSPRV